MIKRQMLGAAPLFSLVFAVSLVGAQEPTQTEAPAPESGSRQSPSEEATRQAQDS